MGLLGCIRAIVQHNACLNFNRKFRPNGCKLRLHSHKFGLYSRNLRLQPFAPLCALSLSLFRNNIGRFEGCQIKKYAYFCFAFKRQRPPKPHMEQLLQLTWRHRLFGTQPLFTTDGQAVEVLASGWPNQHTGPDFLNAQVRIGSVLWAGDVEVHLRSSDWYKHGHDKNPAYNSVILHVVQEADETLVKTAGGKPLVQLCIGISETITRRYARLLAEEVYPPCHNALAELPAQEWEEWLERLLTSRLKRKATRVVEWLDRTGGDWERTCFIALARNYGFGTNGEAFEAWAWQMPLSAVGKHRDHLLQVEALFLGMAGLLDADNLPEGIREAAMADDYFKRLKDEFFFLAHKFTLSPADGVKWRFHRLRPQSFPTLRLAQLADWYHREVAGFTRLIEAANPAELRDLLHASAQGYWEQHYSFGAATEVQVKQLQKASVDLLIINTVIPLLYAHGTERQKPAECQKARRWLRELAAESNYITRAWRAAGVEAVSAAQSQALIELRTMFCDRKACLHCPAGAAYLGGKYPRHALTDDTTAKTTH